SLSDGTVVAAGTLGEHARLFAYEQVSDVATSIHVTGRWKTKGRLVSRPAMREELITVPVDVAEGCVVVPDDSPRNRNCNGNGHANGHDNGNGKHEGPPECLPAPPHVVLVTLTEGDLQ